VIARDLLAAIQSLAGESLFEFEDRARLQRALDAYQRGRGDLSDYLIGHTAAALGARTTFTFDRGLAGEPTFTVLGPNG
jgi:predicted nucleic-acid-binding protein